MARRQVSIMLTPHELQALEDRARDRLSAHPENQDEREKLALLDFIKEMMSPRGPIGIDIASIPPRARQALFISAGKTFTQEQLFAALEKILSPQNRKNS